MDDEDEGGTLIDVPRSFVDDAFMKYKVSKVKNPVVKSFWEHEYANTGDREKQEMIPYFSEIRTVYHQYDYPQYYRTTKICLLISVELWTTGKRLWLSFPRV